MEETVRRCLQPILQEDVDVIVLGCTHFPALRPVIERVATPQVQVIDSGLAIARRAHYVLDAEGMIHPNSHNAATEGQLRVWCSGDPEKFSRVASKLLEYTISAQHADI